MVKNHIAGGDGVNLFSLINKTRLIPFYSGVRPDGSAAAHTRAGRHGPAAVSSPRRRRIHQADYFLRSLITAILKEDRCDPAVVLAAIFKNGHQGDIMLISR